MISNPIIKGFNPDPVICRRDKDYYIATSTFEWFPGVRIYHSTNLDDWSLVAQPLDRVSQLDMKGIPNSGGVWAPCLTHHDDIFWLIYSNVKSVDSPWKCGDNFLVTADNITGPWSEPIKLPFGGFDPSLFHDTSGRKFISYRRWGARNHSNPHNNIILQEYFHDKKELSKTKHTIFTGTHRKFTEAPHIYQVDNYYYLLLAEGGTLYDHAVTVLRSKHIDGPYELHPNEIILTMQNHPDNALQKAGHGSMIQTHQNEWYIVFLVGRPLADAITANAGKTIGYCTLGRETALDKVEWKNGWPYIVNGGQAKRHVPLPSFYKKEKPTSQIFIDDFDADVLHSEWQTLRIPFNDQLGTLVEHKSVLRLFGQEPLISQFTQSTLGHRWKHFNFDAHTRISFSPNNEQQNAGLACYYDTQNWIYCFIEQDPMTQFRTIKIIQVDHGQAEYFYYDQPIVIDNNSASICLKVCVRQAHLSFEYAVNKGNWLPINTTFDAWKLSDDYVAGKGFFTGAFVCLHCSDLSGEGIHADFHHFEYRPLTK